MDVETFVEIMEPLVRELRPASRPFTNQHWDDWYDWFCDQANEQELRSAARRWILGNSKFPTPSEFRAQIHDVQSSNAADPTHRPQKPKRSPHEAAKQAVNMAISHRISSVGAGATIFSFPSLEEKTNFDVAGLMDEFLDSEIPDSRDEEATAAFFRKVRARFEERWGIWTDPARADYE